MGHYHSEMMSDREIAHENWERERLELVRSKLRELKAGDLPLVLLGPALRILGEIRKSEYSRGPDEQDFEKIAAHLNITLKPFTHP